jgi:hypothetical protein
MEAKQQVDQLTEAVAQKYAELAELRGIIVYNAAQALIEARKYSALMGQAQQLAAANESLAKRVAEMEAREKALVVAESEGGEPA